MSTSQSSNQNSSLGSPCALAAEYTLKAKQLKKEAKKLEQKAAELDSSYTTAKQKHTNNKNLKAFEDVVADKPLSKRVLDALAEVHSSSLVSGLTTHSVNIGVAPLYSVVVPAQKMVGHLAQREWSKMADDAIQITALMDNAAVSMKYAILSARHDQNFIDQGVHIMDQAGPRHAMSSKYLGVTNKAGAMVIDAIGTGFRAMGHRIIGAGDELVTQMNYRAAAHAKFASTLRQQGMGLKEAYTEAKKITKEHMSKLDNIEGGNITERAKKWAEEEALDDVIEYTREMTFKGKLNAEDGGILKVGSTVNKLIQEHPLARIFVFPFVRTPAWLMEIGIRNTPVLNILGSPQYRKAIKGLLGKDEQAKAMGQMATGISITGTAFYAALNGNITGSLSGDYRVQRNAADGGATPFSFVYEDDAGKKKYIQYNYLDPIAMPMGIAAQVAQYVKKHGSMPEQEYSELLMLSAGSVAAYLGNKAYFQGVTNLVEAFTGDEAKLGDRLERWSSNQIGGFVPNMINQGQQLAMDNTMRETRNAVDKIFARLPLLAETLPPKYNFQGNTMTTGDRWVGNVIPLRNSTESDDIVDKEIADLAIHMDKPFEPISPYRANYKVDLRDYKDKDDRAFLDVLAENISTKKGRRGMTLNQELANRIKSTRYKRKSIGDPEFGSPRMNDLKKLARKNREWWERKMLKESQWKDLAKALDDNKELIKEYRYSSKL